MSESEGKFELATTPSLAFAPVISVLAVVFIGVYPTDVLNYARASIAGLGLM